MVLGQGEDLARGKNLPPREGPGAAGGRKAAEGPGPPRRTQSPSEEAQGLLTLAPKRAHPQAGQGRDGASLLLLTMPLFRSHKRPPKRC